MVDLAIRKKQLDTMEQSLRAELEVVARERDHLRVEHESIATADQNWSASASFQARLGADLAHARGNPSAKALADYFNIIAVPAVHPDEDGWLRKSNEDLRKKSGILTEQCRDLAAAMALDTTSAPNLSTTHFKNTLEQVSHLNDQVIRRFAALKSREKPKSRLKLVQKT